MTILRMLRKLRLRNKPPMPVPVEMPPETDTDYYLRTGRHPWSRGYSDYKNAFIAERLADPEFLQNMASNVPLPPGYGEFLDERVVEYPWFFSRLSKEPGSLLDAGSVLNLPHIICQPAIQARQVAIVTLAPETYCFWQKAVSYLFADLRALPFRDHLFDEVVSLSTIEHIGKDNTTTGYTGDPIWKEDNSNDYLKAVGELKRVCKPGGRVLISVPYGKFTDFGWYQQFDAAMIDRLVTHFAPARVDATYFRYVDGGWRFANAEECANCEGFDFHSTRYRNPQSEKDYDPDFAAASRGIAALELWKGPTE